MTSRSRFFALGALALGLLPASLDAQEVSRTRATYTGNSELNVLDVAFARRRAGSSARTDLELRADGRFLDYAGRYYSAATTTVGARHGGSGSWALRVGADTVRAGVVFPWFPGPRSSVTRDLLADDAVKVYGIGGFPLEIRGNLRVTVDLDVVMSVPSGGGSITEGTVHGNAVGRATGRLLAPFLSGAVTHRLEFGDQRFRGRVEAWPTTSSASLRYDLGSVRLELTKQLKIGSTVLFQEDVVRRSRGSQQIFNFV